MLTLRCLQSIRAICPLSIERITTENKQTSLLKTTNHITDCVQIFSMAKISLPKSQTGKIKTGILNPTKSRQLDE